ncbi:hypothetical protein PhCBS80983_g04966 [Powellomyces hirtus]|uniref:AB hydrolase-1 domain-containing protein n=1 Tax=Powellomyces hirtus TaxID=109895 RepID=A0A507DWZ7_9FUNG|nr:hypothetical protein PhCBS80983_g04966 [Powellomyces hirtus]
MRRANKGLALIRFAVYAVSSYAVFLSALVFFPEFQPHLIYINWLRVPWGVNWSNMDGGATEFGFLAGTVRTVKMTTPDNVTLGAWHILPSIKVPQSVRIAVQDEDEVSRDRRFTTELASATRVFLYFHGNAGNRATYHRTDFYKMLQKIGERSHVVAVDYRGFGDSDRHVPSERGVQIDAVTAFDWVTAQGVDASKIVLVGHSLGTGVATWLAHNLTVSRGIHGAGLLLLAAYASMPDAALGYPMMPLLWPFKHHPDIAEKAKSLVGEKWDSANNIKQTGNWPVLLLHGRGDYEILPWQSRALFRNAVSARYGRQTPELSKDLSEFDPTRGPDDVIVSVKPNANYQVRIYPRNEGWLYMSHPVKGDSGKVWYLDVLHAGHNSLGKFQIVDDVIQEWEASIGGVHR